MVEGDEGDGADESAAAGGGAAQAGAPARAASRRECPGWVKRAVPDGPARSRLLHSLSANDAGQVVDSTSGHIVLMRGDVLLAIVLACIACLADNLQASADAVATEVMQHFYVSAASATWAVPTTTIRNVIKDDVMKSLPRALFFAGKLWQSLSPDDLNRVYAWLPARWPTMLATPGGRKMGELCIVPKATLPAHLKFTAFDGDEEFASSGKERWLLDSVVRLDFPCIRAGALHAHPENLRVGGGISMGRGGDDGGDGGGEDGARLSPSEGYASSDSEGEGEDAANDEEEGADLGAGVAAGAGAGAGVQRRRRAECVQQLVQQQQLVKQWRSGSRWCRPCRRCQRQRGWR